MLQMCSPTVNSLMLKIFSQCSFAAAICVEITYNTDNVSHQKSLNRPSVRIPISSPYFWLLDCFHEPSDTSMSGLLSFKILLQRPVGLGSTTLKDITQKTSKYMRENTLCRREEVLSGETTCITWTSLNENTFKVVATIVSRRVT